LGILKGRDPMGDLVVSGRIMLKGIIKKWGVRVWTGFI
jgi:hypothetical protein